MNTVQKAAADIYRLTDEIVQLAGTLSEEQLRWKPADDVWSVMEILCHVEEVIPYWLLEIQAVVQAPGSEWGRNHLHEGRLAAVAKADQRTAVDIQQGILATKRDVERILGSMTPQDLAIEAPSKNPRWAIKPMSFIVDHLLVEHLKSHLGQIKRNLDQYAAAKLV